MSRSLGATSTQFLTLLLQPGCPPGESCRKALKNQHGKAFERNDILERFGDNP